MPRFTMLEDKLIKDHTLDSLVRAMTKHVFLNFMRSGLGNLQDDAHTVLGTAMDWYNDRGFKVVMGDWYADVYTDLKIAITDGIITRGSKGVHDAISTYTSTIYNTAKWHADEKAKKKGTKATV